MMQSVSTRIAKPSDVYNLLPLVNAYLDFYQISLGQDLLAPFLIDICNRPERGCVWLAECAEQAVGFATLYKTYSTFQAKPALILNDLFVNPDYRKRGIGTRLFEACREFYQAGNYAYLEWASQANNENAIQFYLGRGAKETQWKVFHA